MTRLAQRSGKVPDPEEVERLVRQGLLAGRPDRLQLTPHGVPLCDAIVRRLAERSVPAS